jgi:signal transduction histidine kinase
VTERPGSSSGTGEAPLVEASVEIAPPSDGLNDGFLSGPRRSLAWRLTAAYLLTTLFVLVGLGLAIYFFTAFYLDERLDADLAAQAEFYAAYVAHLSPDEDALASLAPTVVGLFASQTDLTVRVFAARNGTLLAATQDIGPQPSRAALAELRYRSPTMFIQPSRDLSHRRYAARPIVTGEQMIGVVEVSRSTLTTEHFLISMRNILLVALLIATLASLLVGVFLARRMSRPIREVERATQRIAAGDLDVRLRSYPPDEIGRLARSVNCLAGRLKHLEAARAQFISEISHDLRTPLTALKGLLVNLIDDSEPGRRSSLRIAERETDRLIRLVNQLLDFSRWQGGQLRLDCKAVDVGEIARDALLLVRERANHRNVRLSGHIAPDLPAARVDSDRVKRVILNLLDNGIKFTPAGGEVALLVTQREEGIEISVQDTGRGMAAEEQERAFEPYYRGAGGGTGLGLAIARAIVEAHGGRMSVESSPGQGTRVWFTLPL